MAIKTPVRPTGSDAGFAAQAISLRSQNDRDYLGDVLAAYDVDKDKPWKWFNSLGEIHFAISRSAHIAGYGRIRVGSFNPDGTLAAELTSGAAVDVLAGLTDPYGGTRGLLERFYTQRKVCGDSYLIRAMDGRQFVGHMFLSPSELVPTRTDTHDLESVRWRSLPYSSSSKSDKIIHEISRNNFLGRVWKAHPQWRDLPDSPLMALETECELLWRSTQLLKSKMMNRLTMAGLLLIPSEIQMVANGDVRAKQADQVLESLVQIMTANYDQVDTAAAVSQILMRAPAQYLEAVRFLTADESIFEQDLAIRRELIERILFGLDISRPATTGESQNRFQSWMGADEDRRVAVQPDLEDAAYAFNKLVLWPALKKEGWEDTAIMSTRIFITLERADIRANRSDDTGQAADRILVGAAAQRRGYGFAETDAPSDEEAVRILGRMMKNPYFATYGLPIHDELEAADAWQYITGITGPDAESPADDPAAGPGGSGGGPNDSDPKTPDEDEPPQAD